MPRGTLKLETFYKFVNCMGNCMSRIYSQNILSGFSSYLNILSYN